MNVTESELAELGELRKGGQPLPPGTGGLTLLVKGVRRGATSEPAPAVKAVPDGACPTCGGSGNAKDSTSGQFVAAPCPDCKGTGNQLTEAGAQALEVTGEATKGRNMSKKTEKTPVIKDTSDLIERVEAVAKDARYSASLREEAGYFATFIKARAMNARRIGQVAKSALDVNDYNKAASILQKAVAEVSDTGQSGVRGSLTDAPAFDPGSPSGLAGPTLPLGGGETPYKAPALEAAQNGPGSSADPVPNSGFNPNPGPAGSQLDSISRGGQSLGQPQSQQAQLEYATKEAIIDVERKANAADAARTPLEKEAAGYELTLAQLRLVNLQKVGK